MNLALFDFDGTITYSDTYTAFVYYTLSTKRRVAGFAVLGPLFLGYKMGLVSGETIRSRVSKFSFKGWSKMSLNKRGEEYSQNVLPSVIRPKAMDRIEWHKKHGDTVVLVSASLDVYLSNWCLQHSIDLICTELECIDDVYTGNYIHGDCAGTEKSRRILEKYTLGDFSNVYAYGDTPDDKEMLELADKKFYRWNEIKPGTPLVP